MYDCLYRKTGLNTGASAQLIVSSLEDSGIDPFSLPSITDRNSSLTDSISDRLEVIVSAG